MKRLFNKYMACDDFPFMEMVDQHMGEIADYAKAHGIDLHDALGVAHMALGARFGEEFLRHGINLRKKERANHVDHLIKQDQSYLDIAHPDRAKKARQNVPEMHKCGWCLCSCTKLSDHVFMREGMRQWSNDTYRLCDGCKKYLHGSFKYAKAKS